MTVDTRQAARRELRLRSLAEVRAELARIEGGGAAGTLVTTGNWTPGENVAHVGQLIGFSLDGFPERGPWWLRAVGAAVKPLVLRSVKKGTIVKPGIQTGKAAAFLEPRAGTTLDDAIAMTRGFLDRVEAGERFTHPSPLLGRLTHEQWAMMHCSHASMHWSFLWPNGHAN
ncbi:MAG: DUF1569 domain-containing protein [Phycisphaerales bacterium]|nr:MAG: DUF1569 domain-containing protein [Phycisphaerales bacterium]